MKAIRILSLILALLLLALPLVACQPQGNEGSGNEDQAPDTTTDEGVTLKMVEKSLTSYVIIYDYMAGPLTRANLIVLQDAFKTRLGCDIEMRECFSDRQDEDEPAPVAKEILIGNTTRPESAAASDGLKTGDYRMEISGEKLVLAGGSDQAVANVILRFLNGFVYDQGNQYEVARGGVMDLKVNSNDLADFALQGKYSYDRVSIGGARLDSYVITYAEDSALNDTYKAFAGDLQTYITRQTGYPLDVKKDTQVVKADYQILIGETKFSDKALAQSLHADEYYIGVSKTETGAYVTILFGRDAVETAMAAFQEIMPSLSTPLNFNLSAGFVKTNVAQQNAD